MSILSDVMVIEWGDAAAWAGVVVSVASLGIASGAVVVARKSRDDACRSADASERSASAAERQTALAEEEAAKYIPRWNVVHVTGVSYQLVNGTDEPARNVRVVCPKMHRGPATRDVLHPWSTLGFKVLSDWSALDGDVEVTWRRSGETDDRTWSTQLPPKTR